MKKVAVHAVPSVQGCHSLERAIDLGLLLQVFPNRIFRHSKTSYRSPNGHSELIDD
jgi:hypothetical protein